MSNEGTVNINPKHVAWRWWRIQWWPTTSPQEIRCQCACVSFSIHRQRFLRCCVKARNATMCLCDRTFELECQDIEGPHKEQVCTFMGVFFGLYLSHWDAWKIYSIILRTSGGFSSCLVCRMGQCWTEQGRSNKSPGYGRLVCGRWMMDLSARVHNGGTGEHWGEGQHSALSP